MLPPEPVNNVAADDLAQNVIAAVQPLDHDDVSGEFARCLWAALQGISAEIERFPIPE